jgi:hypothetical protein
LLHSVAPWRSNHTSLLWSMLALIQFLTNLFTTLSFSSWPVTRSSSAAPLSLVTHTCIGHAGQSQSRLRLRQQWYNTRRLHPTGAPGTQHKSCFGSQSAILGVPLLFTGTSLSHLFDCCRRQKSQLNNLRYIQWIYMSRERLRQTYTNHKDRLTNSRGSGSVLSVHNRASAISSAPRGRVVCQRPASANAAATVTRQPRRRARELILIYLLMPIFLCMLKCNRSEVL